MHFLVVLFCILGFFFLVGVIAILHYIHKGVKFFRRAVSGDGMSDKEFQRMSNKYYRGNSVNGQQFDDDYFKGSSNASDGQQQQQQRRTTRTASGVTIFDNRDPNVAERKIFNHDEGEYVDFKEED